MNIKTNDMLVEDNLSCYDKSSKNYNDPDVVKERKNNIPYDIDVDISDVDVEASNSMKRYFALLQHHSQKCYDIAKKARSLNYDPEDFVEISIAKNMAERVVGLISVIAPQIKGSGVVERIIELESQYGALDWRVALKIAEEIAFSKYCQFESKKEAIEVGIRTGFAYSTVGVVSSPLDGFVGLDIKKRYDGKEYFCIKYAGPIRNAGGTNAALSVLIADYVRKKMGYDVYDPDEKEKKRIYTELQDYNERVTNLQYKPYEKEIAFLMDNIPIEVGGLSSERFEVSNYKDLPRIETNIIRSGVCLIMSGCIPLKAPKLWKNLSKWGNDFDMEQWNFLGKYVKLQKQLKAQQSLEKAPKVDKKKNEVKPKILPDYSFIADMVAGRPVISHPMAKGGLRLRYGRSRTSGYSGQSIHPATTYVLNDYIAIGTQLKVERPGKGASFTPCDTLEGPIVKLKDGSVVFMNDVYYSKSTLNKVKEILFLGDVLINYGDFYDRGHVLAPCGYNEEWYILEFKKKLKEKEWDLNQLSLKTQIKKNVLEDIFNDLFFSRKYPFHVYLVISKILNLPVHPFYTVHYKDETHDEFKYLLDWLKYAEIILDDNKALLNYFNKYDDDNYYRIVLPLTNFDAAKRSLELLGVPHDVVNNQYVIINQSFSSALIESLNLKLVDKSLMRNNLVSYDSLSDAKKLYFDDKYLDSLIVKINDFDNVLDLVNDVSSLIFRDKSGISIGARMGRPEKAKLRKIPGNPHAIFPVGEQGGRMNQINAAVEVGYVNADFSDYICESCNIRTPYRVCLKCNSKTKKLGLTNNFDVKEIYKDIQNKFGLKLINSVKGLKETINADHIPELLAKGILRSKYSIQANRDGTIRYDASELTCTHFKPKEVETSVEKLRYLGYVKDIYGNDLVNDNQILEIKPQDVILPSCPDAPEEPADAVLIRTTQYLDELLVKVYNLEPYFNVKTKEDLVGHLIIGLAPHTSAGMVGRIIGFTKSQGFLAHPYYHAAERRDTDGDELGFLLLLDGFLNFSSKFLSNRLGSTMDAPLVLTTILRPSEVDDMAFNVDVVDHYPLELYEGALEYKTPYDVKVEIIKDRLGKESQYEGMFFTHGTDDFNTGVLCSAYKTLPSMQEKLNGQLGLGIKIRAVDASDVARLVIEKHFLKDLKGNLRKFSMQKFRCVGCNASYRRPPLLGKCTECGGKIIFTISEGSVVKYLESSLNMARDFNVSPYLKQTLDLLKLRIEDVFGKDSEKQSGLSDFLNPKK